MTADSLDPVIHAQARLRIVATLAALPDGAGLSFTRLQDMLELTPGNLITHLRKLEDAGYLSSETTGNGRASLQLREGPRSCPHLRESSTERVVNRIKARGRLATRLPCARHGAVEQHLALARVARERCGALELGLCLLEAAKPGKQVPPHTRQQVVGAE